MPFCLRIFSKPALFVVCAIVCAAQTGAGLHEGSFRNNQIGFTYHLPAGFSAKVENELPLHDPKGRERLILALWSTTGRTEYPQISSCTTPSHAPRDCRARKSRTDIWRRSGSCG